LFFEIKNEKLELGYPTKKEVPTMPRYSDEQGHKKPCEVEEGSEACEHCKIKPCLNVQFSKEEGYRSENPSYPEE